MRAALGALALLALAPVTVLAQEARSCQPADIAALAGWHGVWIHENLMPDINGREEQGSAPQTAYMELLGLDAPWNETGWAGMEEFMREVRTAGAQANGWSYPIVMQTAAPLRFFVTPQETVITSQYRDIRYIPTDGRPLLPEDERWPTIWGTSVGCWEGDTLVIETASVRYDRAYNFITAHLSDQATFLERLRLVAPDRIEGSITITDPVTLTRPWEVALAYDRHPFLDRLVHEGTTGENNRVVEVNGMGTIAPPDEAPPPGPVFPAEIPLSADELAGYAGSYAIDGAPPGAVLTLELRGNRLFSAFPVPARPPALLPFYADGPGSFHSRALAPLAVRFERDATGNVVRFTGTSLEGAPFSGTRQR
jgi:hypothetical protein